ncbi:MAG: hypothetical protein RL385_1886 [Pseudomonadota bacterium]|jgi:hypothetical protein
MRDTRFVWSICAAFALGCGDDGRDRSSGPDPDTEPSAQTRDATVDRPADAANPGAPARELDAAAPALDAVVPSTPDASGEADASAQLDGGTRDASSLACPADACPNPDYACAPSDDGLGYSCVGQYAAWPMPDSQAGAKVAPRYAIQADANVVLDEITGLLWQRALPATFTGCTRRLDGQPGDGCTWQEAADYCAQLTLAGRGWRLPSKVELESIVDTTQPFPAPLIDLDVFPDTSIRFNFWSSSRSPACGEDDQHACKLNTLFGFGTAGALVSEANKVRCVHSERLPNAPPDTRFERQGELVRDRYTTLEWRGVQAPDTPLPEDADAFCAALGERWRLPTVKELLSLADLGSTVMADDPVFGLASEWEAYWSSTESKFEPSRLFYLPTLGIATLGSFLEDPELGSDFELRARCVR